MIAIGFDFDHTLAVDQALERTALVDLAGELGLVIGANDVSRLAQIDTLLSEMRVDKMTLDEMVVHFVESIGRDATQPGYTDRFKAICYALLPHHVRAVAGANELFPALRERGIAYAILTNGWSPLQEKKAMAIGFDGPVVVSGAVGVSKPDPRAFGLLRAQLPKDATLWYVGDNPIVDVEGSLDAGFVAVWYHEHAGVSFPDEQRSPSATLNTLSELLALIDAAGPDGRPGPSTVLSNRRA